MNWKEIFLQMWGIIWIVHGCTTQDLLTKICYLGLGALFWIIGNIEELEKVNK